MGSGQSRTVPATICRRTGAIRKGEPSTRMPVQWMMGSSSGIRATDAVSVPRIELLEKRGIVGNDLQACVCDQKAPTAGLPQVATSIVLDATSCTQLPRPDCASGTITQTLVSYCAAAASDSADDRSSFSMRRISSISRSVKPARRRSSTLASTSTCSNPVKSTPTALVSPGAGS